MINNDQSTLLLYCCEDVKSHRSEGDNVPLNIHVLHCSKINTKQIVNVDIQCKPNGMLFQNTIRKIDDFHSEI